MADPAAREPVHIAAPALIGFIAAAYRAVGIPPADAAKAAELMAAFFGEVTAFDSGLLSLNLFYLAWIVLIPFSSRLNGHG